MRNSAVLLTVLVAGAAALAQSPQIHNGRLQTHAATSLTRDLDTLAAQTTTTPIWVAWQVPKVDGDRSLCCTYYSDGMTNPVRGCTMEPREGGSEWTPPNVPAATGPVQLEAGTSLIVYARLVNRRLERLRVLTDDCPVDAGGREVRWLTGVSGADSVAFLKALATNEALDVDVKSPLASAAVRGIAHHRDPSAVTALIELAQSTPLTPHATSVRRDAMQGLGQSGDPRALAFLAGVITK
ncbi:MAG: hypothetical protein AMXMBFR57_36490 [Acidimicrobiia bacterium]